MVGTDNKPEMGVSITDNIEKIFEEYGLELWFMFFVGLLLGIILTCCFFYIKKLFQKDNYEESDYDKKE